MTHVTPEPALGQVAVVVVTYNNSTTLAALVASLVAQPGAIVQLVVRDNGSSDTTVDVARAIAGTTPFPMRVVVGENVGFAAGIDAAVDAVSLPSAALLVVNPDVVLAPGILSRMLEIATRVDRVAIVTAPLRLPTGEADSASRRRLPQVGSAVLYSALGRLTPRRLRYNDVAQGTVSVEPMSGLRYTVVEATTGALMLVHPEFRNARTGVFDRSYWMYGEDLQLCADARREGQRVVMLEEEGSVHLKGASSGMPRSRTSDRAFHHAMYLYYRTNLRRNRVESVVVAFGIALHLAVSRVRAVSARRRRGA